MKLMNFDEFLRWVVLTSIELVMEVTAYLKFSYTDLIGFFNTYVTRKLNYKKSIKIHTYVVENFY